MIRNENGGMVVVDPPKSPYHHYHRPNLAPVLTSGDGIALSSPDKDTASRSSVSTMSSGALTSGEGSPCVMSPWNQLSPENIWPESCNDDDFTATGLIRSIVREEGHIYSLAVSGDLLYTGSDSKNIRVWKNMKDFSGFKSKSGFVKAIVVYGEKVFTGHQDGKIRVWKVNSEKKQSFKHKRFGSLPTFKDKMKSSMNPKNFVEARRHRNAVKGKHYDAVSCLSLDQEQGFLYSGSWDRTVKVWRISDSKCLESIDAHEDAINSVVTGFDDLVFTGSADGSVKVWKRRVLKKMRVKTEHVLFQELLRQENAVTALAVDLGADVAYCGSSDGMVNFWEWKKNGEKLLGHGGSLRGHKMAVLCLVTAARGGLVMSGSADKNICIWRRGGDGVHTCLSVLTGHTGPVKCLAVAEEEEDKRKEGRNDRSSGRRWIVYSGSLDRSVKIWRVSEHAPSWRMVETGESSDMRM